MAKKKPVRQQAAVPGGTNFKVLRSMYSQELGRQLHRGEVVALSEDANVRNAVHLGFLSTTDEQPPEPKDDAGEAEAEADDTGE